VQTANPFPVHVIKSSSPSCRHCFHPYCSNCISVLSSATGRYFIGVCICSFDLFLTDPIFRYF